MTEQQMHEIIAKKADEMKDLIPGTRAVIITVNREQGSDTLIGTKDKSDLVNSFLAIANLAAASFFAADHHDVEEEPPENVLNTRTYLFLNCMNAMVAKTLGLSLEEHKDAAACYKVLL